MSETSRTGGRGTNRWAVEASVRTTQRVDESVIAAVRASIASCHGVVRCTGAPGVSVRFSLEAETPAGACSAALALLARTVLPLLEGATLMDLHVTADETPPERIPLSVPTTAVATAP
ncbi:hypothetical protein [Kocuria rosea]|uniref:hypothetical protein n=1 Tax=Kocuria rosea TaxID=1275 RepID=UPI000E03B4EE|nr:hypothetical protein [Kocuria rosea]STX33412.1 Uncharacterised protein [Kocuria rosea]